MKRFVLSAFLFALVLALALPAEVFGREIAIREPLQKVSPSLKTVTEGGKALAATVTREIDGRTYLDVFLDGTASEAELKALGVIIESRLPNGMMTAEVPLDALRDVAAIPGVTRITAAYLAHPCLDLSVPLTQARPSYWTSSPPNFTGQAGAGVIVGDVNSGIDYKHGDFKNPDGTTRLLYIWDQIDTSTPHPSGYTYGREFTAANINANLPTVRDGSDGHGTHCMGIAAGDGSQTGNGQPADVFIGMAPRADMIAVVTDYSTAHIVDGVNYIFQKAAALGKNAVVNLSLGNGFGAHLGTESFDTSLNALTGAGKIIVASAGNDGGQSIHALQLVAIGGGNQTVTFSVPSYSANSGAGNDFVIIDAYYEGTANMTVSVTSPRGTSNSGNVTKGNYVQKNGTAQTDGAIYLENGYTASPSGLTNIYIQIWDYAQARYPRLGTWTVTLTPVSGPPTTPQLDLWLANFQLGAAYAAPVFSSDVDEHDTVGSPGAAANVIAVGAITNKNRWDSIDGNTYVFVDTTAVGSLTSWSSVGPMRDGAHKPDIVSAGGGAMSTLSSAVPRNASTNPYIHPDGQHWMMSGTSMAAPHVAGGVALMLADTPNLTPAQVKTELYADALVDGQTGAVWNYRYGNGKLRTLRADTQAPSVTVTSPNGGENWAMGSSHNVTWTATDNVGVTSIDLAYSTNNGGSWTPIATGEANDGTYPWTVPSVATTQALVKVTAHDAASNTGLDTSNAVFTISDQTAPSVTVTSPNGGENWAIGSSHNITWTATDNIGVTSIDIAYSTNNGGSWTPVATGEANDGTYPWTVPVTPTAQALVKVTAHDAASNTGSDNSNAVFTISDQTAPTVAVTSPNGGESWAIGSSHNITWTATDNVGVTSIDLEYSTDHGANWIPIATGEANDGTYPWTVPGTATAQALVRATAHDAASNSASDASDDVFAIVDESDPSVTVIAPNGGESWATGSSHDITWTAADKAVTSIDIDYSVDGGANWLPVAVGEANDGTYGWTVPEAPTADALVQVTAHDGAGNDGSDVSDAVFAIADESDPSVTVTSPNGGESWATGSSHDITWTAADNIGVTSIDIDYSIDGGANWLPVAIGEANDGTYGWTVPETPTADALVQVTAHDGAGNAGSDVSDAVFAIVDQGDPSVTVTSPNGGESWATGSSHDITWTATDNIGVTSVDIDYSIDGGANWLPVAVGEANDGTYEWTVPETPTADALVQVTAHDGAGNTGSDVSDVVFTIVDESDPSVTVSAPNGGESWATGSSHDITWTATDNIGVTSVDIDYSIDGGANWIPVAVGEANDGTYEWTVPETPTADALVQVTAHDGAGNTGSDVSEAVFAIVDESDPSVTVTAPNGGESWAIGSSHDITWTATDNIGVTSVDIDYSIDGGANWLPVAVGEANDGTYEWTVPETPTADALVQVTAHDGAGNTGSDVSEAVFAIVDESNPSVTVTAPNGGESWAIGSSHDITWTATDNIGVTSVDIDYSIDGGANWLPVAVGEANDGTYGWTVPEAPTADALVQVTAHDGAGNDGSDVSDAVFAIADESDPSVTVTSPNGGESWATGSSHDITWTAADNIGVTSIDIDYSIDGGANWLPVAIGEANDGTYGWTVPETPTADALVQVTAHDGAGNAGSDVSDAVFAIVDQGDPSVTVTSPNGGESWATGSSHDITWTATDNIGVTSVDIDYSIDGGANWLPVAVGEANDGTYEWTVPETPTADALVQVTAHDGAGNTGSDVSDVVFTIVDESDPSVTVSAPNGGESWATGSSHDITWTATDNIGVTSVDIDYSIDGGANWIPVAVGEANDGTYEWTVPETPTADALVQVTAHDGAGNTGSDVSEAVFAIVDESDPSVTVTAPNGGESWAIGSSHDITWTATDNIGVTSVDIDYSIDGGANWLPVAVGEANDGTYEWTVPETPTADALVQVTAHDGAGNTGSDVSEAVFAIVDESDPSVTVTAPNGGESWAIGSSHDITWTATDNIGVTSVDIDYSIDGGANWLPVAVGEANDGTYGWTVPEAPTADALVQVTAHDGAGNDGSDVSDAVFAIADESDPSVTVTSPNGGESWATGSSHDITWTAADNIGVTSIDIDYSIDGGANWLPVAIGEANDGTYGWTVPETPTADALVQVTAHDGAGNDGSDASDAVFAIVDEGDPSVTVTAPNGGESWDAGSVYEITWTAADKAVTSIDIEYSNDNGSSWLPVATGEDNDGTYDWTVPDDPTDEALVRVTAYDAAGNSGQDESDLVFSIESDTWVDGLLDGLTRPIVLQNRPNPFNPTTVIDFALPEAERVVIEVYSLDGRVVRRLVDREYAKGHSQVVWDGRSDSGEHAASGVYFYSFRVGDVAEMKRLVITK